MSYNKKKKKGGGVDMHTPMNLWYAFPDIQLKSQIHCHRLFQYKSAKDSRKQLDMSKKGLSGTIIMISVQL